MQGPFPDNCGIIETNVLGEEKEGNPLDYLPTVRHCEFVISVNLHDTPRRKIL